MNNVIIKIKNTLESINHKINEIEAQISDMVDRVVKITSPTGKKKGRKEKEWKEMKKVWETSGTIPSAPACIHIIGVPERRAREKETDKIFEKIITGNFANMRKETVIQVQEVQRSPYR